MTVSTHTYRAFLIGTPDVELSVKGGRITLDDTQAPHVSASLDLARPDDATLELLDRRDNARVRVEATATYPGRTDTRTFNLGVRDRSVPQADGTVSLSLASDEALLQDWAPLADVSLYAYRASLRSIVNQVLGTVIPGASLAASPSIDADCTPYWDSENLIPNSTGRGGTAHWSLYMGDGGTGTLGSSTPGGVPDEDPLDANPPNYVRLNITGATTGRAYLQYGEALPDAVPSVSERTMYTLSGFLYQSSGAPKTARISLIWKNSAGGRISARAVTFPIAASWTPFTVTEFSPTGTAAAMFEVGITNGMPAGSFIGATAGVLAEGTLNDEWFDGSKAATAHYVYGWQGAANESLSIRTALTERALDSLTWRAGQSALDVLMPLVQAAGYRLVCDEARTWTLRGENYVAGQSMSIRYGLNLIDGTDTFTADDDAWFDAQITKYTWRGSDGTEKTRTDAYALATPYTKCNVVEVAAAYPGPGRSAYAVRRAQGRGREISATVVSDWRTRAEESLTVVLEGAPIQTGKTSRVVFDLDRDEMTITSRTTDTPVGAIDLLPGTIDALTGTIDSL